MDSYLAALAPEEESNETTGTGQRFGGSQVYQLRLPLMANEQLKEIAARRGTSPAALARDWVMQHLSDSPGPAAPGPAAPGPAPADPEPMRMHASDGTPAWPQQEDTRRFGGDPAAHYGFPVEETDTEITIPRGPLR